MVNPTKTVALPPKAHTSTVEEIPLLESVDVRFADEGGMVVICIRISTDECVLERAMEVQ